MEFKDRSTPSAMAPDGGTRHGAATSTALSPVLHGKALTGRVLGVCPAGLYLHFGDVATPAVIALLPTSSVRLPLAMVSAGPLPSVRTDVSVAVGGGVLRVGTHVWHTVRWFEPRPPRCRPADVPLLAAAQSLEGLSDSAMGVAAPRAWAAAAALALGDPEPCCELLGAGPGLTPAGDDVVAGALAACTLSGTGLSAGAVAMLLARARLATTALSAALLTCAADGQVVPQAAGLLRALSGAAPVAPALGRLRAVGSTSGTALAVGIVAALGASRFDQFGQLADSPSLTERLLPCPAAP